MSRTAAHSAVSTALARYSDHELRELVEAAEPRRTVMTEFIRRFQENPQLSARFWNASSTSTQPPELSS